MAVLKTQELAGLDLVTDGELMRFDPSHPETNGMVDYFASQMDGIRKHFTLSDFDRFRADRRFGLPSSHGGHGGRQNSGRHAEPAEGLRVRARAHEVAAQIHVHRPAHAVPRSDQSVFTKTSPTWPWISPLSCAGRLELVEADTVQLDEACIVGFPQDAPWAAEAINHVLDGVLNGKGRSYLLRQLWRPADAARVSGAT